MHGIDEIARSTARLRSTARPTGGPTGRPTGWPTGRPTRRRGRAIDATEDSESHYGLTKWNNLPDRQRR